MAMRVVTWPLGYILVAKGAQTLFVATDTAWAVVNVGLTWICVRQFGLAGAGIAFFGAYVVHLMIVYPLARRLAGFRWSSTNLRTGVLFVVAIGTVFTSFALLAPSTAMAVGIVATGASAAWSLHALRKLVAPAQVPRRLSWLLKIGKETR